MIEEEFSQPPRIYPKLLAKCQEVGFSMPSDAKIGSLLKALVASKPHANILELGTGISLSLSWMLDGLNKHSRITSLDNDPELIKIALEFFGDDDRLTLVTAEGGAWLSHYQGGQFDLIFADSWPGKYHQLEVTLDLIRPNGFYIVDDMSPQPNWPEGHAQRAKELETYLQQRDDFTFTRMNWSTGVILCTKK